MTIEGLYDRLQVMKRAKQVCIDNGHDRLLDYVNLEIISLRKQIRLEREGKRLEPTWQKE